MTSSPLFSECIRLLRQQSFDQLQKLDHRALQTQLSDQERQLFAQELHQLGISIPYRAGSLSHAIWALQLSTFLAPTEALYWRALARAWYSSACASGEPLDLQNAIRSYDHLQSLEGMEPEDWADLGKMLQLMGRTTGDVCWVGRSIQAFHTALDRAEVSESELGRVWLGLAHSSLLRFEISHEVSSLKEALRAYEQTSQRDPLNAQVWVEAAQMNWVAAPLLGTPQLRELALKQVLKAVELTPDDIRARCWAAQFHSIQGTEVDQLHLLQEAQVHLQWLERHAPESAATALAVGVYLESKARYFEDTGLLEQAVAAYHRGCERAPSEPRAWAELGAALILLADVQQNPSLLKHAVFVCQKASELRPWHLETRLQLAVCLIRSGQALRSAPDLEQAISLLEQLLNQYPSGSSPPPDWRYHLGCAYDFLGDVTLDPRYFERAVELLQAAFQSPGKRAIWRLNLAQALVHYGEASGQVELMTSALEHFQQLTQADPELTVAWLEWGQSLLSIADMIEDPAHPDISELLLREAEEKLMHAAKLGEGIAYFLLGCCYSLARQPDLAINALRRASSLQTLPPAQELAQHEWLQHLQGEEAFQQLLAEQE